MIIIDQLASSLGRRDEMPNIELAERIADSDDRAAVNELLKNLNNKNKDVQNDCIKVLYEIGERKPALLYGLASDLVKFLDSKNNRLQWGAMTALNTITLEVPAEIYASLPLIIEAADKGSVITKDQAVNILIKLCTQSEYADAAFALLIEQLLSSPTNQLPMYAENALPVINDKNKALFISTLSARLNEVEKESKRKRIEKVIRKLS